MSDSILDGYEPEWLEDNAPLVMVVRAIEAYPELKPLLRELDGMPDMFVLSTNGGELEWVIEPNQCEFSKDSDIDFRLATAQNADPDELWTEANYATIDAVKAAFLIPAAMLAALHHPIMLKGEQVAP